MGAFGTKSSEVQEGSGEGSAENSGKESGENREILVQSQINSKNMPKKINKDFLSRDRNIV